MLHKASADRLQHLAEAISLLRRHQQMDMVRHEHIGMNLTRMLLPSRAQRIEVKKIVILAEKDITSVISPVDDVLRLSGKDKSGLTGHGLAPLGAAIVLS